ncbi:protein tyrosine phosphatase family protein [Thioflexithrix psekupsensis]|uniref:Phosphatase n=1 Tax=Thioflexithrix psekupsensis TaxID=1570016 RepID=A0A251X4W5_9GAMM|nr:protein tyrosine phosphatase family protein [Thioflexithrix psekupsensis]OUD12192.1 phosphatase [Thioflexithrix psekupsensis]
MSLAEIDHLLVLSDRITTAGQPNEMQLIDVAEAGFQVVMNLALNTSTHAIVEEAELVESLGMTYVQIPVLFDQPELSDFQIFLAMMSEYEKERIFLHCAANKRVSVFMYLYRLIQEKMSHESAMKDLQQIWQPNAIWQHYIDHVLAHYQKSL